MKLTKRFASLLFVLVMIFALTTNVFAAETGSITINGISSDNTYSIYKLLDLESYDLKTGAYSYKVNSDWTAFFSTDTAKKIFSVDEAGYATWIGAEDDATVAAFAKNALEYAKNHNINPTKTSATSGDFVVTGTTGVFSGLELGYYLIDSTMGALCGLTTTNPNASINAKNGSPTIDKQVLEDSTNQWGSTSTAAIGQTVYFRTTINVHEGAENYVLHDDLSDGLTFVKVSKIEHVVPQSDTHEVDPTDQYYSVVTEKNNEEDEIVNGLTDNCDFEIRFTQTFCDHLQTNDKVIVYYEAILNENAVIAGTGNPNETWLEYGEDHYTTHDTTTTYTFAFDLVKTDSQNTLIDGAEFKIYDAATGGNEVAVVKMEDGNYRRAEADEAGESIVVKDGNVRVIGFDNGTYYLEETVVPPGYNKLTERHKFIISDKNLDAVFNNGIFSTGSGVHVVNKTGSMLPETGGMGTTLFYVAGGILVAAAVVLLVTRKRMSAK